MDTFCFVFSGDFFYEKGQSLITPSSIFFFFFLIYLHGIGKWKVRSPEALFLPDFHVSSYDLIYDCMPKFYSRLNK